MTALQPEKELRLDPATSQAVLTTRNPVRTRVDSYPLSTMAKPTLRFQRGGGEDSPGVFLVLAMPDGRKIEGNNPIHPVEVQRQQAEFWQVQIAGLIASS